MLNRLDLHDIKSISIDQTREIEASDEDDTPTFYNRKITFVNDKDVDLTITLYADNFEDLQIIQ